MTPLLLDINGPEFALLLVLAVILFGPERLPDLARKAARIVNYLRNAAGSAQEQLSKELGPGFENLDFRDLNPKTFVAKHVLGDENNALVADIRREFNEVGSTLKEGSASVAGAIQGVKDVSPGGPTAVTAAVRTIAPFDAEAT